jgi:hypothetical protein
LNLLKIERIDYTLKKIYLLNSCDEYKWYSNMSLIMASTSERRIIAEIKRQIKFGYMAYTKGNDNMSKTAQCKMLIEDLKNEGVKFVFDILEFGYVNIVVDGEKQ